MSLSVCEGTAKSFSTDGLKEWCFSFCGHMSLPNTGRIRRCLSVQTGGEGAPCFKEERERVSLFKRGRAGVFLLNKGRKRKCFFSLEVREGFTLT